MESNHRRSQTTLTRELFRSSLFSLFLVLSIFGTVFVLHFGSQGLLHVRLHQSGLETKATVERVERAAAGSEYRPALRLAYRDHRGVEHRSRKVVRSSAYRQGETLSVVYDPEFSSVYLLRSELRSPRAVKELAVMGGIGLLCTAFGWPNLWRRWRRARQVVRLNRNGLAYQGEVLEILDRQYTVGSRRPRYFRYVFQGQDGRRREGISDTLSVELEQVIEPGDPVRILCDAVRSEDHVPDLESVEKSPINPSLIS